MEEKTKLSIGGSLLRDALQTASGWESRTLGICYSEVGDSGETTGLLMRGISAEEPLSLQEANAIYQKLFRTRLTARKRELLVDVFRRYRPLTLKYFVKVITRGLRIGLMGKMVEEAVASACGVPPAAIRDANNRLGDLAYVALAARRGELEAIEARLFHPMEFMLAKPLDRVEDLASPTDWIAEDKYDGIRSQAHFADGHVRLYSRGMEEVTTAFPEIVAAFAKVRGQWTAGRRTARLSRWPCIELQCAAAAHRAQTSSRHADCGNSRGIHGLRRALPQRRTAIADSF